VPGAELGQPQDGGPDPGGVDLVQHHPQSRVEVCGGVGQT
jgi:hypothetical protein